MIDGNEKQNAGGQANMCCAKWLPSLANSRTQSLVVMGVIILCFAPAFLVWGYNSQYMRFVADDFCFASSARTNGLLSNVLVQYQSWGGRYSATFIYGLAAQIEYSSIWILVCVAFTLWLLAIVWVLYQLAFMSRLENPLLAAVSIGVVVTYCIFAASPNRIQSLYWIGSLANYVFPMIVFTLWIGSVLFAYRRGFSGSAPVLVVASSMIINFFLGGFAETYVVFQVMTLGIALLVLIALPSVHQRRTLIFLLIAGFFSSIVALFVQRMSPGNSVRLSAFPQDVSIYERIIDSLAFIPFGYSRLAVFALPGLFALTSLVVHVNLPSQGLLAPRNIMRGFAVTGAMGLVLIWAVKFPSFYFMSFYPPYRALLVPTTVLVMMMVTWGILAAMSLTHVSLVTRRAWKVVLPFLGLVALIVPIYDSLVSLDRMVTFRTFAEAWDRGQSVILSERMSGNRDVVIPPIPVDMYSLLDLNTMTSESDTSYHWVNECMAEYYQVDTILAAGD
ncbi:MAG: hypothetical protein JXB30_06455 [Anaerolineae bacterium]|nr:hypothetical protein [Anaerolineae bacterium]